jgi:hypothetical protein
MTAKDLVANLRAGGAIDPAECLLYMAAHAHEFRLSGGQRLLDQTDFTAWLIEVSRALAGRSHILASRIEHDRTCPRCGHLHEGDRECGVLLGGERRCRCELEVPA